MASILRHVSFSYFYYFVSIHFILFLGPETPPLVGAGISPPPLPTVADTGDKERREPLAQMSPIDITTYERSPTPPLKQSSPMENVATTPKSPPPVARPPEISTSPVS